MRQAWTLKAAVSVFSIFMLSPGWIWHLRPFLPHMLQLFKAK
jgi:hypothetical protein